ncbi:hypothetical protein NKR23_g9710 [Pleurostoma richardsiae]|uniref:Zn(2)-C6 fungal-type domain-containing protein n=1 Tax=Pleurostoma richardsiae TaxID=41990 RepID=A0AA38REZ2_9PEZI|nr:hypothetical protein NKR23_g9710 [Pleurostoma richardsiae]
MVGTPRSNGCETCRKRKKKCGEEYPECLACVSAGWKCPGYQRNWKFIDESQRLSSQYRSKGYLFDEEAQSSDLVAPRGRVIFGGSEGYETYEVLGAANPSFRVSVFWPLTTESDKLGTRLCRILTDAKAESYFPLQAWGNFFQFIPGRLGQNSSLDASVACLYSIYEDNFSESSGVSRATIEQYGYTLSALQACVKDPQLRTDSGTICTSIILQLCELMMNNDNGRWNDLAQGSSMLIQDCGPDRFRSAFERSMLESQRAMLIIQDRFAGRPCFLAKSEWRALLKSPDTSATVTAPVVSLRSSLCDFLVDVPDIFRRSVPLISAKMSSMDDLKLQSELDSYALRRGEHKTEQAGTEGPDDAMNQPETSQGTLLLILRCVANTVFCKLNKLILCLEAVTLPSQTDETGRAAVLAEIREQEDTMLKAFELVAARSHVAAKPLLFGLRQFWTHGAVLDEYLSIMIDHYPDDGSSK